MSYASSVQLSPELQLRIINGHGCGACNNLNTHIVGKSRIQLVNTGLSSHGLRHDAWSRSILNSVRGPKRPVPSRFNVFVCRSVLTPGGNEMSVAKCAAGVLSRTYDALRGSPVVIKLIPAVKRLRPVSYRVSVVSERGIEEMNAVSCFTTTAFPIFSSTKSATSARNLSPKMSTNQTTPSPPNPKTIFTKLTNLVWGSSLPPGLLISTVRTTWNSAWQLMMSQLAPSDPSGGYTRPASRFRLDDKEMISHQNLTTLHLYVGLPCPWAHRTLIVRGLKGLEDAVPVSVASPGQDGSWEFKHSTDVDRDVIIPSVDKANRGRNLKEVYKLRRGGYDGRATVPMLWDVKSREVVCNESYEIIEFFNSGLNALAQNPSLDLAPSSLKVEIEKWNQVIYPSINNGVYRCGFAQSQEAYDKAVSELFSALDMVDRHLATSRYLCGERLTLADICLFTTLIRFDLVYNVIFKCTKKKLIEYPSLSGYMRDIYQIPKVAATCNFPAIMEGYYNTLFPLNPGEICPVMPSACEQENLIKPHNRESLSLVRNP